MKIGLAQISSDKGDISRNISKHLSVVQLAVAAKSNLIIFPELSITGYEPELAASLATAPDDKQFNIFQTQSDKFQISIGVGMPLQLPSGMAIGMLIFQPQQSRKIYAKKYIHKDEETFFSGGHQTHGFLGNNHQIALGICYELSVPAHAHDANKRGARHYIASVAKSTPGMVEARISMSEIARKYQMTTLLVNAIGPASGFICAGQSGVWDQSGHLVIGMDTMREGLIIFNTETETALIKYI